MAAVNACKGLTTEALEKGIIAELRYLMDELITAAGDLDAAIDGATDEFDAERGKLNAVIQTAQAMLAGDTALLLHELLATRGQIALLWGIDDMSEIRPDLTEEQAWDVLHQADKHHATVGVNWKTLEIIADDIFGPAPQTADREE